MEERATKRMRTPALITIELEEAITLPFQNWFMYSTVLTLVYTRLTEYTTSITS